MRFRVNGLSAEVDEPTTIASSTQRAANRWDTTIAAIQNCNSKHRTCCSPLPPKYETSKQLIFNSFKTAGLHLKSPLSDPVERKKKIDAPLGGWNEVHKHLAGPAEKARSDNAQEKERIRCFVSIRRVDRFTQWRARVYRVSCIRRGVVTKQEVLMIPLLIPWTLACNYQAWWDASSFGEQKSDEIVISLSLLFPFALTPSRSGRSVSTMELIAIKAGAGYR